MRKTAQITLLIAGCSAAIILTAMAAGIRINITPSYPIGIYQITHEPITKGSMVIFCPPDNAATRQALNRGYIMAGFCPGGYSILIKKVFAMEGDAVRISADGVFVNGKLIPNSKPLNEDSAGRPLLPANLNTKLASNMIILLSDYNTMSLDSRYLGTIGRDKVIGVTRPLFVR